MFTKFKRSTTTLFLDPINTQVQGYDKSQKLNIIVSPSLYWVQKLSLPVKYVREVKKLLPSIFEDSLPRGDYSYSAYKSADVFFVFAYEDKKILKLLSENGINMSDIQSIHFAQSEFMEFKGAIKINEKQSLYYKDEVLVVAPTIWFEEIKEMDLDSINLSKNRIKLQQYGHIVKNNSLYKIAILISALIIIIFIESFITAQKISRINEDKDELFSKYNLQPTMFQNRSLLKKYKSIYTKQSRLREAVSYFLTMKLQKNQKIEKIDYKNHILIVNISGVMKGNEQAILNKLNTKKVIFKHSFKKNSIKVEIKI